MKCKICEKEFELKKEEKYLATEKVAAFGTLAKLPKTFEAFDCPHCGCQNIVNIREETEVKKMTAWNPKHIVKVSTNKMPCACIDRFFGWRRGTPMMKRHHAVAT